MSEKKKSAQAEGLANEEEVEIEVCCDVLLDALESGGLQVVESEPGVYAEVLPDETGETGIAINYCPFCGQPRPHFQEVDEDAEEAETPKPQKIKG